MIRFHDLRHTFATLSLEAGIPSEVVSRTLGHRNPVITQVFYQHAVPGLEEEAIARFAALVDGNQGRMPGLRISDRYQRGVIQERPGSPRVPSSRGQDLNL